MMLVIIILCFFVWDYIGFIFYVVGFGVFDGCFVLLIVIIISDIVGVGKFFEVLGGLYGVMLFLWYVVRRL